MTVELHTKSSLERSPEQWSGLRPFAVASGSKAQVINVLTEAQKDIASLTLAMAWLAGLIVERPSSPDDLNEQVRLAIAAAYGVLGLPLPNLDKVRL